MHARDMSLATLLIQHLYLSGVYGKICTQEQLGKKACYDEIGLRVKNLGTILGYIGSMLGGYLWPLIKKENL